MNNLDRLGLGGLFGILVIASLSHKLPACVAIQAIILFVNPVLIWWLCAETACAWMLEQFRYRELLQQADVHQINVWWFVGREMAASLDRPIVPHRPEPYESQLIYAIPCHRRHENNQPG